MTDITDQIPPIPTSEADAGQFEHCEHCSAPVDHDQRYCVNCGTHRRHVPDPAAKYMSQVSAHTGVRAGGVTGAIAGGAVVKGGSTHGLPGLQRGGDGISLLGGIALALVPVAAVIGVAIGRASNDQSKQLISALLKERSQVTTQTIPTSNTPAASASTGASAASSKTKTSTKAGTKSSTKSPKTASAGSGSNTTSNGSVSRIAGSKITAAEQAAGTKAAQKIQSSTGKSYVQGSNDLPSTVVVGP